MSQHDFDLRLKHIEEQYAAKREGAEAYRDQEVARLFEQCEWSQEKIAAHMGKKQQWVSLRLIFGRFLKFTTSGCNSGDQLSNLTERRFREHYKSACRAFPGKHKSEEKERQRFEHVLHALRHGIPQGIAAIANKPGIRKAVLQVLDDGKWYTVSQVLASVEESLPGVLREQVQNCITHLRRSPPAGKAVESKCIGKQNQHRLVKAKEHAERDQQPDVVLALMEEASPLIEELEHWGRASKWAQAPGELLKIAARLRRLFESRLTLEHA